MVELLLIWLKIILEIMFPKSSAKLVIKSQIISANILALLYKTIYCLNV